ncbi:protein arginine N-methyltransferase [Aspergillus brunneoviolaceus CBS 621.78]|uniref:Protein methyltransferase n=1 Tax=Aspergillus brunneoviolaceus CBS 621.78 TaxID=1450534 RepID=A0ACD1G5A5_9EURO|nr:protein methyltransferase [Aspergillus brunneoviolaceus CBS 621.78]RAH44445.1 protein methyltransferase [Aspergillus brunneoviolaceus CBS 621.78]
MESFTNSDTVNMTFCIGQHEEDRKVPITNEMVQAAHESNYDMLTAPVTTSHFQSRVLALLSTYQGSLQPSAPGSNGTMMTSDNTRPLVIPELGPADTHMTPNEAMTQLVGVTSSWIDLCSPDPLIADISRQVLMLEVNYAAFCGIGYLLIPGPKLHHNDAHSEQIIYYARAVQDAINVAPYIQFHIWTQMADTPDLQGDKVTDLASLARKEFVSGSVDPVSQIDPFGTWDAWDIIRRVCKYHTRLVVALALPKQLPPMSVQSRWYSEPTHMLTIHGNTFLKNQKGYPVLSKAHQALIARFMRLRTAPWILLCEVGPIPGVEVDESFENPDAHAPGSEYPSLAQAAVSNKKHHDPTPHLSYVRNLQSRQPPRSAMERFGTGYQDYLQAPLQPLTVNLESITYEVFEKDPIKYDWYERAIAKALTDWSKKPKSGPDGKVSVAVVGAGRGPLVGRAIRASAETGVEIDLWAVEKNPNAFVLLQRHNKNHWGGKVTLVHSDMRSWKGPQIAKGAAPASQSALNSTQSPTSGTAGPDLVPTTIDILVSELLGSFGDNELSPECLDGVTHLLTPVHGISIPASYTAHLTPIAAPKLHADVMNQSISNPAAPETPYVVMLHAIDFLSTNQPSATALMNSGTGSHHHHSVRNSISTLPGGGGSSESPIPFVQTTWSFEHPNLNIPPQSPSSSTISNAHNVRRTRLTFPVQNRGVCHGLAGYFETVLYRDIELSTNPVTMDAKSQDMISWFPIYFPLKTPLNVPDNGEVVVTMYRQTDNRKVWYEWMVEVFALEGAAASGGGNPEPSTAVELMAAPVMSGARTAGASAAVNSPDRERSKAAAARSRGVRRVRVGNSDLHSSIKEGCLM